MGDFLIERAYRIIGDLRQLASIKFGQYWNTSNHKPQNANIVTSISRTFWYKNESRISTLTHLDLIINTTFSIIADMCNEIYNASCVEITQKYITPLKMLKTEILNAQSGILNLQGVYCNDEITKSALDSRIQYIRNIYNDLQNRYPMLETFVPCHGYT